MDQKEGSEGFQSEDFADFIKEDPQDIFYLSDLVANDIEKNVYEDDFLECLYNVIKCSGTARRRL